MENALSFYLIFSYFNDANVVGGTNQFGYNLGKGVHVLLSQIQAYVFEFNLSHQSQQTAYNDAVRYFLHIYKKIVLTLFDFEFPICFGARQPLLLRTIFTGKK